MSVTTEFGFSYEYAVDINLGTAESPNWQQIRFISAVDPQVTPVTQDAATYDDLGSPNAVKLSESWTLGFSVQVQRQSSGGFLPEVEKLLALAGPDSVGNQATGHFRWYDDPATGIPSDNDAFEGRGTVQVSRGQTGNDQIGAWSVTITGQGRRTSITNPLNGGSSSASSSASSAA